MSFLRPAFLAFLVLVSGCGHVFYDAEAGTLEPPPEPVAVDASLRVHLADGGVALFRTGADVGPEAVEGEGVRYDITRRDSARVSRVSMDSVLGIESFRREREEGKTILVSAGATIGMTVVAVGGLVAIACAVDPKCFGSCPTIYTETEGGEVLEAELFSYSIAPLLEGRDVDVVGARAREGVVRLHVRNEAMETHSINHLQLLEVEHAVEERVVPDHHGIPLAFRDPVPPSSAEAGGGRDVVADVIAEDGRAFASTAERLASASPGRLDETIELAFRYPEGDSAALVLRARNSLLNTVLFYDMMLGAAGARALDWMADDLQRIGDAVRLGRWWSRRMGLHVDVWDGAAWVQAARLPDTGPIAWTDVAVPIPLRGPPPDGDRILRVRLRFPTDGWRIDRIALASFHRPDPRRIDVSDVLHAGEPARGSVLSAIADPDADYLQTVAGDAFTVEFDVGPDPEEGRRTFLLSSQGYYTEWVRPAWIREAGRGDVFLPSDEALLEAMRRWSGAREEFERRFFETRIPTR